MNDLDAPPIPYLTDHRPTDPTPRMPTLPTTVSPLNTTHGPFSMLLPEATTTTRTTPPCTNGPHATQISITADHQAAPPHAVGTSAARARWGHGSIGLDACAPSVTATVRAHD